MHFSTAVSILSALAGLTVSSNPLGNVVETDVVILGGGATGSYAAVRLREDYHHKVVVVEKDQTLGGHTNTWTDPVTNNHISYGVEVFNNATAATSQFLNRFDVSVRPAFIVPTTNMYADFRDGKPVNHTPATPDIWMPALERLQVQWAKYDSMFLPGTENFPAPADIPEDLLMLWPDFARKYDVEAATQIFHTNVVQNPVQSTVMDVYRAFDSPTLRIFLGTGSGVQATSGNNNEIWERCMELLGDNVMYESQVVTSKRTDNGVELVVRSHDGKLTTIKAKRFLVAIQPDAASPESLDLDENERQVLSRSAANKFFVGVVSHPSLPADTKLANAIPESAPANYLAYPELPYLSSFRFVANSSTGPVFRTVMSGPPGYKLEEAKALIQTSLQNLMDAGTIPAGNVNDLDFKSFVDHGSMYRSYSAEDLRDDIIRKLNALQGSRSTWFTGAAWGTTNIGMLWTLTDTILEKLVEGL